MEIWIVGGIIVAIMVYVSTKIKRAAKEAYEQELFETDEFRIVKPEGFLIPVTENPAFAFEAYSKDFAEDTDEDMNRCWITVEAIDNVANEAFESENEGETRGASVKTFRKLVVSKKLKKSFQLEINLVQDHSEEYLGRVEMALASFRLT
jgi:hypothetical protein